MAVCELNQWVEICMPLPLEVGLNGNTQFLFLLLVVVCLLISIILSIFQIIRLKCLDTNTNENVKFSIANPLPVPCSSASIAAYTNLGSNVPFPTTIGANGLVYASISYKTMFLHTFNTTGFSKLFFAPQNIGYSASIAMGIDGTIFVSGGNRLYSYNTNVYALNSDGTVKWTYATLDNIVSYATVKIEVL